MNLPQFPRHESCTLCPLHSAAKSVGIPTVWLEDSLPPDPLTSTAVVFIGMNPGAEEDQQGMPFVGPAGKKLREAYIDGLDLRSRAAVYLTNAVRCGPSPKFPKSCQGACFPYTVDDLTEIARANRRTAVVLCGAIPVTSFFAWLLPPTIKQLKKSTKKIPAKVTQSDAFHRNGEDYTFNDCDHFSGTCTPRTITHFSTYHPAALGYNPRLATVVVDHLELLNKWLDGTPLVLPTPDLILPLSPRTYFHSLKGPAHVL